MRELIIKELEASAELKRLVARNLAGTIADAAQMLIDAYVTMKITFANTLAEMAEKILGGDADAISRMLGFDSRIGRKYLSGSLAYGGPCFPRDNKAFASAARRLGCWRIFNRPEFKDKEKLEYFAIGLARDR